ncbi:MAG: hypothetical protein GWP63_10545 [Haliea sp.]|jgi:hypothetical protein|nr:hypothetical protein [Haliea sp.]
MFLLSLTARHSTGNTQNGVWPPLRAVLVACVLLLPALASAQQREAMWELQSLAKEREVLTRELEQYEKTISMLQPNGIPAEQSDNPAVKTLVEETVTIRKRLIQVTEREVTLLQEQIIASRAPQAAEVAPGDPPPQEPAMESKPLKVHSTTYNLELEKENVARLHALLTEYYAELQEAARTLPSEEEIAKRETARQDAEKLAKIPFSVDKVRLNGSEGSTALTRITQRLSDPNIPESRRDMAPICSIKTRLFGKLVSSESRSLKPVGKHNYVAKIRLQPGDSTLRIQGHRWEIRLPQDINAGDYLVTLYQPPQADPELHVFAVDDLLAEDNPHIPAWLPAEVNLKSRAG